VEKTLRSGIYLECPNKKKAAEEEVAPKKRGEEGRRVGGKRRGVQLLQEDWDAPAAPTAETHGPVVESSGANSRCREECEEERQEGVADGVTSSRRVRS